MRLLVFPLGMITLSWSTVTVFGDQLVFPEDYGAVVDWLRGHGGLAWLIGALVILGDALLPLPSTPAMFAMGIIYGPLVGGLICGTAALVAGLGGYGLIRALGRRGAKRLVGERDLARTEAFYERWGMAAVVFGRALGGPAEWAVLFAGISGMPFARVALGVAVGAYASGLVVATLGAYSVNEPGLAVVITVAFLALLFLVSHRMVRAAASEGDEPR